jgi:hypothetical protein
MDRGMKEACVFYSLETGEFNGGWNGADAGSGALQQVPEGMGMLVVPIGAVAPDGRLSLPVIVGYFAALIDAGADKVRSMFITNTPGQMATYLEKEAEARRILAGDDAATVFLSAEAAAIGISVADLAAEVVAQADMWRPIGARIEAARRKAKIGVASAPNLGALAQAAKIDWQAVVAPVAEGAEA